MKNFATAALIAAPIAVLITACAPNAPPAETLRPVRTVELRYERAQETNRYVGTVQPRHEVEQAFRVGGKVTQRKVDVGDTVHENDVLAVLDDTDYRLAEQAAREQLAAATTQARQAESDRQRLGKLSTVGSVSVNDDEHAQSNAAKASAAAGAEAKKHELARNRLKYTVLRASQAGVVTAVRFEAGQVVAEGQPIVSVAAQGQPEIVVDVPEDHLASFGTSQFKASLASMPDEDFDVVLRELAPQAAAQTRTFRARLKPATPRHLPLGATATVLAARTVAEQPVATIPASAVTQKQGQAAVWIVHRADKDPTGTVDLYPVRVHGYRNDEVLVSGPQAGELVVTAGVQKMAPGKHVALPDLAAIEARKQVSL